MLDELVGCKLLSDHRYAEARAHALARKFGLTRIEYELRAKGVDPAEIARATREAQATELARARAAWAKRFGNAPRTVAERAKQTRFLQGRGFSFDTIRRVLVGAEQD